MKKALIITIILLLAGMTASAMETPVDMSFYTEEINRTDATIFDLLDVLEAVRNEGQIGIGDFYHGALKTMFNKLPNFNTNHERQAVQDSSRIILRGLAAEKHTEAGPQVWALINEFDVVQDYNDGLLMTEALITLGEIDAQDYVPHIILRLENFNADQTADQQMRRKIQMGVTGCISALEALKDPAGVKPVFYASIGWYDPGIRAVAAAALLNIMEDPGITIGEIILDHFNNPDVKMAAWNVMLRTKASDESKAKVAAKAVEASYTYITPTVEEQRVLRDLRISAFDTIRRTGLVADDSVYPYLERSYRESLNTPYPDTEMMKLVVSTLSAIGDEESVALLTQFLRELHSRRRSGPWGDTEREMMQIIIPAIAVTGTKYRLAIQLLSTIQRSSSYTGAEQNWAGSALRVLTR